MMVPKVGLALIILKEDKVLLGKRNGSHGNGAWAFPGGHVEKNETFVDCAYRENNKETGLKIKLIEDSPVIWTNDIFKEEGKHYHTFFMKAKYVSGKPKIIESNKCEEWKWFKWNNLPYPLFLPVQNLIKLGYNPFEDG